jgi:hypothetical protein
MLGNEVHIQRGETWSLDFSVTSHNGHPFVILKNWSNPYLVISVATGLYGQPDDYQETYWLDLDQRYVEKSDGSVVLEKFKRFISAEVLWLENGFIAEDVIDKYGLTAGGKIVLDQTSDFDITNFLFFCDPYRDGNNVYRYVESYKLDSNNEPVDVVWVDYDFRVIKQFNTRSWTEQKYFYDIKILAGESVQEHLVGVLNSQGITDIKTSTEWSNDDWEYYISQVVDENVHEEIYRLYNEGVPLMPSYDTKNLLLEPTSIYVSTDIQGGVR